MQIISYRPVLRDIQNEINQLFQRNWRSDNDISDSATSHWSPHVDIKEEAEKFIVIADLPGVEPKDVEVSMENNVLTLKGRRTLERQEKEQGYSRMERFSGSFCRQFTLPDSVEGGQIEARTKNGVVAIIIPKKVQRAARKIEVKAAEGELLEGEMSK
jgi:HSP20 family protein